MHGRLGHSLDNQDERSVFATKKALHFLIIEAMSVVRGLIHSQATCFPPGPDNTEGVAGHPASGTSLQTLAPHILPGAVPGSLESLFSPQLLLTGWESQVPACGVCSLCVC